jgi:hypothetical protein
MKTKLFIFSIAIFASALSIQADQQEEEFARYTKTNTVPITAKLTFFLSSRQYGYFPAMQFKSDELINWGICQNPMRARDTNGVPATNGVFIRYLLFPSGQSFDSRMLDDKGGEVPKIQDKDKYTSSTSISPPENLDDFKKFRKVLIMQGTENTLPLFRPDEMFVITNKGVYTLEIRMRICVPVTNSVPDYKAMQNTEKFFCPPYGIVVSEPLRVKVIKE